MEVLRCGGRLADLDVVVRGELQIALDAGARMLRALAFIAMRQQHDHAGQQSPLVFAGRDELVDDNLRAVGKVAELRLPQHQRLGIVAAVAVLEAKHAGFRKHRVVNLKPRLVRRRCWPAGCSALSVSISMSTAWRWLKVPRC